MGRPLEGIRVIDFGRFIAGPYCAMLLADMGADVIRVERREGGEDRYLGPIVPSGEGSLFLNLNRNKRGITVDPTHEMGQTVLSRLIGTADIVVVNLPIDVMRKLRLDYDSLCAIRPDIVLVMASAFGPDGPYATRVGFDAVAQAMSGAMSLTGFPGPPVRSVVSFMDYGTALHAAFGAVLALYERQKTGRGQLIDVSLLSTGAMFMQTLLAEHEVTGIRREQRGNAGYHAAPSDVFRTRDGWVIVPTIGNPMFRRWAKLVGREDLIEDPRFRDDIHRGDNYSVISEITAEWCALRTREQVVAELEAARIPCGPVYSLNDVLTDPQVRARGLFQHVGFPGAEKEIPLAATPVRIAGKREPIDRRAPRLGEHTDEVLHELGFSEHEIASLRAAQAI